MVVVVLSYFAFFTFVALNEVANLYAFWNMRIHGPFSLNTPGL